MADIFGFTDTWDAVGTTYTGIGLTVTDTASASGSKLIEATASSGGSFIVDKNATVRISNAAGTVRRVEYRTSGSLRLTMGINAVAESGANAGSNGEMSGYADDGTTLIWTNTFLRSNGRVGLGTATPLARFHSIAPNTYPAAAFTGDNSGRVVRFYGQDFASGTTGAALSGNFSAGSGNADFVFTMFGSGTSLNQGRIVLAAQTYLVTTPQTVSTLLAAATAGAGARSFVTDATDTLTAGIGTIVAGGGANGVPVVCDGTDWRIG